LGLRYLVISSPLGPQVVPYKIEEGWGSH
jgi:hypothetical protein